MWRVTDWQGDVYYVWTLGPAAALDQVYAAATAEYGVKTWVTASYQ